jgi:hypothetical protein
MIGTNGDIAITSTIAGAQTYSLMSINGSTSDRKRAGLAQDSPETMTMKHQSVTRKGVRADRRLARIDVRKNFTIGEVDVNRTSSIQLVIDAEDGFSVAQCKDLIERMVALLALSGFQDKFLNGEP